MKNLKKTVSEIKTCPQGMGAYYEVFYNRATDELFTCFQVSLGTIPGQNSKIRKS